MSEQQLNRKFFILLIFIILMVNTIGEKELKTSWDALTASDSTKAVGHKQNLTYEKSFVPVRDTVGI